MYKKPKVYASPMPAPHRQPRANDQDAARMMLRQSAAIAAARALLDAVTHSGGDSLFINRAAIALRAALAELDKETGR